MKPIILLITLILILIPHKKSITQETQRSLYGIFITVNNEEGREVSLQYPKDFFQLLNHYQIVQAQYQVIGVDFDGDPNNDEPATLSNITQAIQRIPNNGNTVLMMVIDTHGFYSQQQGRMVSLHNGMARLHEIVVLVQQRNPALCFIVSDTCNTYTNSNALPLNLVHTNAITFAGSNAIPELSSQAIENLKHLFLDYKGSLVVSASSIGEYAWRNTGFGNHFSKNFFGKLTYNPAQTWNENMQIIIKNTQDLFQEHWIRGVFTREQQEDMIAKGITSQTPDILQMPSLIQQPPYTPPTAIQPPTQPPSGPGLIEKTVTGEEVHYVELHLTRISIHFRDGSMESIPMEQVIQINTNSITYRGQ